MKGGQLYLREAAIVEGGVDDPRFRVYSVATVFSPQQARYDLSAPDPAARITDVAKRLGGVRAEEELTVVADDRTRVRGARVNMWDLRTFDCETTADLGGTIDATVTPVRGSAWRVHVTNDTRYDLREAEIVAPGARVTLGALPRGASREVRIDYAGKPSTAPQAVHTGSDASIAQRIRRATVDLVNGSATPAPSAPTMLLAWVDGPLSRLALDGVRAEGERVNLVVVRLPFPPGGLPDPSLVYTPPTQGP
jgi:hypothetical protein